jgi:hypothetical protein
MTSIPTEVTYGKVIGRYILAVGDTSDPDSLPNAVPPVGYVTFTPALPNFKAEATEPTLVAPFRVRCLLDANGNLIDPDGSLGVWLIAGIYKVNYTFQNVEIASHVIEVTAEHDDLNPLDLVSAIPPGGPVLSVSEYTELSARIDAFSSDVNSVNGQTGVVVLDASDVGALTQESADVLYATLAALSNEADARSSADAALDTRVDSLEAVPPVDLTPYATDVDLAAETAARQTSDSTLAGSIATEATTRASEDVILANAINTEATTRAAADAALDGRVDVLESAVPDLSGYATDAELTAEATTRANADSALNTAISSEATTRANADSALNTAITNEATTRATEDTALHAEIDALDTGKAPVIHIHTKGDITDFNEAVDDRIGAIFVDSANVDVVYDDNGNVISANLTGIATDAELAAEASTRAAADTALDTRVDALEAAGPGYTNEMAQDVVGAMIQAAGGSYDDTAGTITLPASSGGGGAGLFRGLWSTIELMDTIDASSGIPSEMTTSTFTAVANPGGSGAPSASQVFWSGVVNGNVGNLVTRTASFVVPAGVSLIRVKKSHYSLAPQYGYSGVQVNGSLVEYSNTAPWATIEEAVTAGQTVALDCSALHAGHETQAWFGPIELLGAASPYMAGEYVIYNNRLWRSDSDNNAGVPGTAGWTDANLAVDIADVVGLQTALDAEATARANADSALDTRVDALESGEGSLGPTAWQSYTPALEGSVTNPTLGTGAVQTGKYRTNGSFIEGVAEIAFGSSGTNAGSGLYLITLPPGVTLPATPEYRPYGTGIIYVDSNIYVITAARHDATRLRLYVNSPHVLVSHTSPINALWGTGDTINIEFAGEIATGGGLAGDVAHTHVIADVTSLQTALDTKVASTSIDDIVVLTQAAYDALGTKDAETLYVIVG